MLLSCSKTKYMTFNFCNSLQFDTRLYLSENLLDRVKETKLLGVIISEDLTWHSNTRFIMKKAHQRMNILQSLFQFNVPIKELVTIYILYIRSILEQSCVVWGSAITKDEETDLERVQKCALRLIMREEYTSYERGLQIAQLSTLKNRQILLQTRFATKCTKNEKNLRHVPLEACESSNKTSRYI